jgi:hypothetical protein
LAAANHDSDSVSILMNRRDGKFVAVGDHEVGHGPAAITAEGFDADGPLDRRDAAERSLSA